MTKVAYNFLNFVNFKDISLWSAAAIIGGNVQYSNKYSLAPLASFLRANVNHITIDDETLYTQLTLRTNNGGVVERGKKRGKDIGTKKQTIVNAGQFIISKIDARNGAFGIVPKELDGAIVTNDFPSFNVDTNLMLPGFLPLVTTTKQFVQFAQSCSSGTTNRQRIDLNQFLETKVPLPTLEEQLHILSEYHAKMQQAEKLQEKAKQAEIGVDTYIMQELEIGTTANSKTYSKGHSFLQFIRLKDVGRWDVLNKRETNMSLKYQNRKFSEIIKFNPQYGAAYSSKEFDGITRYIRITAINDDGSLNEEKVSANGFSDQYVLEENDFLIARSGNTVGKTFLYKRNQGKAIYAGYLIRFVLNEEAVVPEFVLAYTKSTAFKTWVQSNMRVSGQPNINSKQYMNVPIPIPPKEVQKRIVAHVTAEGQRIKSLRQQAQTLREQALLDFERKIFR